MQEDPRTVVEAPIRRAIGRIAIQGVIAAVASLAALAALVLPAVPDPVHEGPAVVLPIALFAYALAVGVERLAHGPVAPDRHARAWRRAAEVDPGATQFARALALWAPVAVIVCLAVSLWSHVAGGRAQDPATFWLVALPAYGWSWVLATIAWADACRSAIARADAQSEERFRSFWAHPKR